MPVYTHQKPVRFQIVSLRSAGGLFRGLLAGSHPAPPPGSVRPLRRSSGLQKPSATAIERRLNRHAFIHHAILLGAALLTARASSAQTSNVVVLADINQPRQVIAGFGGASSTALRFGSPGDLTDDLRRQAIDAAFVQVRLNLGLAGTTLEEPPNNYPGSNDNDDPEVIDWNRVQGSEEGQTPAVNLQLRGAQFGGTLTGEQSTPAAFWQSLPQLQPPGATNLSLNLPPTSVTSIGLRYLVPAALSSPVIQPEGGSFILDGGIGQPYEIQTSSNLLKAAGLGDSIDDHPNEYPRSDHTHPHQRPHGVHTSPFRL